MTTRTKMRTYSTYVPRLAPTRKSGAWTIRELPIGADTPDDAAAFAGALCDSLRSHAEIEAARLVPDGSGVASCASHDGKKQRCGFGAGTSMIHTGRCSMNGRRGSAQDIAGGYVGIDELAERFRAKRGIPAPVMVAPKAPRKLSQPRGVATVAPVAPSIPAGDRVCPRCLRADFRSEKGRTWHVENNPECVRYVKPAEHTYLQIGG